MGTVRFPVPRRLRVSWSAGAVVAATIAAVVMGAAQPLAPQGGRGGGPPLPNGRAGAPVDLTGTWVSVVTEDWLHRMVTPDPGDYTTIQGVMNPQARKVADSWTPAMDGRCEAYGVAGLMRMPTRLRISWQDDFTLKIESDAGQQTRLLHFTRPGEPAPTAMSSASQPRTLQGYSAAEWVRSGGAQDAFLERQVGAAGGTQRWGGLRVVTTNMLAGWLRRNGVPYSQNTTLTEHFTRFTHPEAGDWFVVTSVVEDPTYLTQPFVTSSNFKKEPDDSKWNAVPCKS